MIIPKIMILKIHTNNIIIISIYIYIYIYNNNNNTKTLIQYYFDKMRIYILIKQICCFKIQT